MHSACTEASWGMRWACLDGSKRIGGSMSGLSVHLRMLLTKHKVKLEARHQKVLILALDDLLSPYAARMAPFN